MKILFTNAFIGNWTGSELYIRDLAVELIRRGHKPVVFSPRLGKLAMDFRAKSIPVADELSAVGEKPDLIHGQHHLETMMALSHFPYTPAVYFCHGWLPWEEQVPIHPRILGYVTVSDALHDRLVFEYGIPPEKITTIYNFVDLEKFNPRPPLPTSPQRALVFNNQASESNFLGTLRQVCAQHGITLDTIGYETGNPSMNPEQYLGNYDVIFARGRAALESLATGAAVICCGAEGLGEMVTLQNLDWMRRNNFGIRVQSHPMTNQTLSAELLRYDAADAQKVSAEVRAVAGLTQTVDQILSVYQSALDGWAKSRPPDPAEEGLAFSHYLKDLADDFDRTSIESSQALAERNQALAEKSRALTEQSQALAEKSQALAEKSQALAEQSQALARANHLHAELDDIHSRTFWKAYVRVARIAWLHRLYVWAVAPIRRRRVFRK